MTHTHLDSHHIPSIKHLPEVNGFQKKTYPDRIWLRKNILTLVDSFDASKVKIELSDDHFIRKRLQKSIQVYVIMTSENVRQIQTNKPNHDIVLYKKNLNPYLTNGFSHRYHLGESTFIFRDVRSDFKFLSHFLIKFFQANRIAPDGTPRSAASHLGLCCLPMSHKTDTSPLSLKPHRFCISYPIPVE